MSAQHAIGSRISLISKSEIRYEGFLNFINAKDNTVGLKNVRMFGTEGRKGGNGEVPAGDQMYEYIVFRGADIKDLTVYEEKPVVPDPAVISAQPASGAAAQTRNAWKDGGRVGGNAGGGRGGYHQQPPAMPQPNGGRGRGFTDRRGGGGAPQPQAAPMSRGPRLEHTGREFAVVEGGQKEFKEDFDFSKANRDLHEGVPEEQQKAKAYDKQSSFFDNLSSDATDRQANQNRPRGPALRAAQKQVDSETFGGEFVGQHQSTRYRRSGGRGRGRFSNRR